MPVQFAPTPPNGAVSRGPPASASGGVAARPTAPSNRSNISSPGGVKEILKTVTPNYVVTAVIKNRLKEGKIKAQKKKRRTRSEILAGMDLRELQVSSYASCRSVRAVVIYEGGCAKLLRSLGTHWF